MPLADHAEEVLDVVLLKARSGTADISEAVRDTADQCQYPRQSERRCGRKNGSIRCHWTSLSSHRPRIPSICLFPHGQQIAK